MTYQIDGKLRGPDDFGIATADWHIDFISRSRDGGRAHAVCVQFGSHEVDRA
jgi:hypothetical protein